MNPKIDRISSPISDVNITRLDISYNQQKKMDGYPVYGFPAYSLSGATLVIWLVELGRLHQLYDDSQTLV